MSPPLSFDGSVFSGFRVLLLAADILLSPLSHVRARSLALSLSLSLARSLQLYTPTHFCFFRSFADDDEDEDDDDYGKESVDVAPRTTPFPPPPPHHTGGRSREKIAFPRAFACAHFCLHYFSLHSLHSLTTHDDKMGVCTHCPPLPHNRTNTHNHTRAQILFSRCERRRM
uniref:Putative secreted protein n=1 Tax=Anopheles marajoara TaxID=58244 RepID=A0A2M4C615_9DIPT